MTGNGLATIPSTGAIERAKAAGLIRGAADERRFRQRVAKAQVYARGTLVAPAMRGKPDVVLAVMLLCLRFGYSEDAVSAVYAWDQNGRTIIDPPAQMYQGAAANHGWETLWGHVDRCCLDGHEGAHTFTYDGLARGAKPDPRAVPGSCGALRVRSVQPTDDLAELLIRRFGEADEKWESFSFSIDQAKKAGLLNKDVWQKYPADMLASKASRRAVRRKCPEVLFGVSEEMAAASGGALALDADIVDAEIVSEVEAAPAASEAAAGVGSRGSASPVDPAPATTLERDLLRSLIAHLTPEQQAWLTAERAKAAPPLPKIADPAFTAEDAAVLARMAGYASTLKAEAEPRGSGEAEDAGGSGAAGAEVEPAPATTTYAQDEEPFE